MIFTGVMLFGALAIVLCLVGLACQRDAIRDLERELEALKARPDQRWDAIKGDVAALETTLEQTRDSMRRQFGTVFRRLGGSPSEAREEPAPPGAQGDFEALLALQSAPPAKPQ